MKVSKVENYKNLVDSAIFIAERDNSKLNAYVEQIYGLTSKHIKHLIYSLVDNPETTYLEIGTYRGATLAVAASSRCKDCVGIDNFSFNPYKPDIWNSNGWNEVRNAVHDCIEKFRVQHKVKIIEKDVLETGANYNAFIPNKRDVIFFDIDTFTADQVSKSLPEVVEVGKENFVLIVANGNKDEIDSAASKVLESKNYTIEHKKRMFSGGRGNDNTWWNGVIVYVVTKPTEAKKAPVKIPESKNPTAKKAPVKTPPAKKAE